MPDRFATIALDPDDVEALNSVLDGDERISQPIGSE